MKKWVFLLGIISLTACDNEPVGEKVEQNLDKVERNTNHAGRGTDPNARIDAQGETGYGFVTRTNQNSQTNR